MLAMFCCNQAMSQDSPTDEQEEVASMMESHLNIVGAYKSFDVLIEGSSMVTIDDIPSHEIISRVRWIRCHERDEQLYVRTSELHPLTQGKPGDPAFSVAVSVGVSRNGIFSIRYFPEPVQTMTLEGTSFEYMLALPELRFLGLNRFPLNPGCMPNIVGSVISSYCQPRPGYAILRSTANSVSIRHSFDKLSEGGGKYMQWYEYDPAELVFTQLRHHQWSSSEKKFVPWFVQKFEWGKIGSFLVPRRISGENLQKAMKNPVDKKVVEKNELEDYFFRWNSINSDIDESAISHEALTDIAFARGLTEIKAYQDNVVKN